MSVATPRCIDWGVLGDAALHSSTPSRRVAAYLRNSMAVRDEDDDELPPDIEFSLGGHHFKMSFERFAVHLGIYYELEIVRDDFTQGLT
ncbi:hypothetical protein R6Q57_005860 [Mikania cordata]